MPSFKIPGFWVLEKKICKGFYQLWAWWPSWSCDLDYLYILSIPLPIEASYKIWLCLARRFPRRRCLNIMVIYMYIARGQGQTTSWGQNVFINVNLLSICPLNDILPIFPIQMHWQPKLTLLKTGQGHPRVMIYVNFVELHSPMLHAKFQNHRPSSTGEDF